MCVLEFSLNRNFGIAWRALYLLLHKSVKTFPSALAKMVRFLDFFLKIWKKKIDEFTNKLSFVTPEKSKREAMSEVQVFSPRWMISSFWKSLLKTLKSNIFFLNYINLEHDITFTFSLILSFYSSKFACGRHNSSLNTSPRYG